MTRPRAPRGQRRPARQSPAREIRWSDRGREDLRTIGDYIARDNPLAAGRWIGKLLRAAEGAARMPGAGRIVPEIGRPEIREVLLRTYRIIYRVRDSGIEVLTVFEGHRLFPEDVAPEEES